MTSSDLGAPHAVLFDLDGTLIDSAPDLAGAANDMRAARGMPALPYEALRPLVGSGARGMVGRAFGIAPGDEAFPSLREEFLGRYERRITDETVLFPGIASLLERLMNEHRLPCGIVTNKAARFSEPLVRALGLTGWFAPGALVSGDSTAHSKPHPAPLLEAARRMGVAPSDCWYVGDDLRDMQAGRAAAMHTVAVTWGYLGDGAPVASWGADAVIDSPAQLLKLLRIA